MTCRSCYRIERAANAAETPQTRWQRRHWNEYRELLDRYQIKGRGDWQQHLRELRDLDVENRRLTREELKQWWLDEYGLDWCIEVGSWLDFIEDLKPAAPGLRMRVAA